MSTDYYEVIPDGRAPATQNIVCSICKTSQRPAIFHQSHTSTSHFTSTQAALRDAHFAKRICSNCKRFWDMSLKTRKTTDENRWEFCEQFVLDYFRERGVPAARTIRCGPDIMITLFQFAFRIEVKSGRYDKDRITARAVTPRRSKDHVVVVMLPDNKMFWLEMGRYRESTSGFWFDFSRAEFDSQPLLFSFESALRASAQIHNIPVGDFRPFGLAIKPGSG